MNGRSAGSSSGNFSSVALRGRVVVAQVAAAVADARVVAVVKVDGVQVVKEARVVVDVRGASVALRRAQRLGSQPRCRNKARLLTARGDCGSG